MPGVLLIFALISICPQTIFFADHWGLYVTECTHTHTHAHAHILSLSLSHTHTHMMNTLTLSLTHTQVLSLFLISVVIVLLYLVPGSDPLLLQFQTVLFFLPRESLSLVSQLVPHLLYACHFLRAYMRSHQAGSHYKVLQEADYHARKALRKALSTRCFPYMEGTVRSSSLSLSKGN